MPTRTAPRHHHRRRGGHRGRYMMRGRINPGAPHFYKRTVSLLAANVNTAVTGGAGCSFTNSSDSWYLRTGTGSATSFFTMAQEFTLDMLPDYADYTNLYDQYKINAVKVKVTPYSTAAVLQSGEAGASNQSLGIICHSVIDYDDAATFAASTAGINLARQYRTYKTRNFLASDGKPLKRYVKPRVAQAAYGGGVFGSYANMPSPWVDMNSPSVQHYGIKWLWEVFQPDTAQDCYIWFKIEATLYLECREPR